MQLRTEDLVRVPADYWAYNSARLIDPNWPSAEKNSQQAARLARVTWLRRGRLEKEKRFRGSGSGEETTVRLTCHRSPEYMWAKQGGGRKWADRDNTRDTYIV